MNRRHLLSVIAAISAPGSTIVFAATSSTQKYPDVVSAHIKASGPNLFDFDVTVSSPYDSAQRYADAFRARSREGVVYGERILWHDHAGEQPFTRDMHAVRIPAGVRTVIVEARDKSFGYGGKTIEVKLPGR